jgi:cytochrome c oxidase subunit 1
VFIANVVLTRSRGEAAPGDPWDGRTLEWSVESPTPEYNFHEVPVVNARDEWWHRKYEEDREGRPVRVPAGAAVDQPELASGGRERGIHLPDPSYWPLVVGVGLMILSYGAVYMRPEQAASSSWSVAGIVVFVLGLIVTLSGIYGWALEPLEEPANGDHSTG